MCRILVCFSNSSCPTDVEASKSCRHRIFLSIDLKMCLSPPKKYDQSYRNTVLLQSIQNPDPGRICQIVTILCYRLIYSEYGLIHQLDFLHCCSQRFQSFNKWSFHLKNSFAATVIHACTDHCCCNQ